MQLEVILNEDVPKLGEAGQVVKVSGGFARNYLIPRRLAVEANAGNVRALEHQKRLALRRRESKKVEAAGLKERLEQLELTFKVLVGEEGKLFGSVTNLDLERALHEKGIQIERRKIILDQPIKQLGEFAVPIKLDREVEATLRVAVVAQENASQPQ